VDAAGNNVHETGPAEWGKRLHGLPVFEAAGSRV